MSEFPTPVVAEDAARPRAETLNPQAVESLLADFRTWIERAAATDNLPSTDEWQPDEPLDLHTLLSQFTALRHEVNLQTKAARAQQEQNTDALEQYRTALEALQTAETTARESAAQEMVESLRPILKNLVDAFDALALARREVDRVQTVLRSVQDQLAVDTDPLPTLPPEPKLPPRPLSRPISDTPAVGFWGRLFGKPPPTPVSVVDENWKHRAEQLQARVEYLEAAAQQYRQLLETRHTRIQHTAEAVGRVQRFFDSVLTGYTMSLQRLERTLQQCDLEPIPSVGEPFDPELMEVVEVTADSGQPANEVIEEVRRGYLWRGRVFRYAQVRVAKP